MQVVSAALVVEREEEGHVLKVLAKMVLDRELVPTGILASDQYKPSVRYKEPE
jgi:hypothetical protein